MAWINTVARHGFDAIESKDGELVVHHYLGIQWKAPLAFEPGLDAFAFLAFLADDWETVRGAVSPATWASIEEKRAAGKCTHVVSYDPSEAGASQGTTDAAGAHYGVRLMAKSLFDL